MQHTNFCLTSNLTSFLKSKKRFIVMTKTTSTTTQLIKKSIVAPLFLGMLLFGSSATFAQVEVPPTRAPKEIPSENMIYNSVETRPEYPGGIKEFFSFVGKNFKTPIEKVSGKVFVQFVVEKDGSITDIKVMRDIGYGTGEEAIRVMKLSPKWIPGKQDGKPVRVLYSLPISIKS